MRLIPRDEQFFVMFGQLAKQLTSSAQLLIQLFSSPDQMDDLVARIKSVEHDADKLTRDIIHRINTSFITPIDREDIHLLTSRLDNVVDLVDGAARRTQMFHVREMRPEARELAQVLERACTAIEVAVVNLKKQKIVEQRTSEVKALEEEGDAIYHAAIGRLFSGNPDPLEVIKWRDLFERVEDAIDQCEDVANTLEAISLKHL